MSELTKDDKKYFDERLDKIDKTVSSIHQVLVGFEGKGGYLDKIDNAEKKLSDHDKRIKTVEEDKQGKIETKKAIFGMIGSGGLVGLFVWLSQFLGGKP